MSSRKSFGDGGHFADLCVCHGEGFLVFWFRWWLVVVGGGVGWLEG